MHKIYEAQKKKSWKFFQNEQCQTYEVMTKKRLFRRKKVHILQIQFTHVKKTCKFAAGEKNWD